MALFYAFSRHFDLTKGGFGVTLPPVVSQEGASGNGKRGFMDRIKKTISSISLALIISFSIGIAAVAAAGGGTTVGVSYTGQTVDTITFDGVTVEAKYSPGGGYGSSEYSCAALVMKFYKSVYGFDVWNLSSSYSVPTASNGAAFVQTGTPRVGDIVRFQDRTHWALVKSVSGSTVTLIEQNWGYYSGSGYVAAVNRTVEIGDGQVSFFTYSAYGETLQAQRVQEQAQVQEQYDSWEEAVAANSPDSAKPVSIESEDSLKQVALESELEEALGTICD